MNPSASTLAEKIQSLHPDQIAEVENFVEILRSRSFDRRFVRDAATASNRAFESVWNNMEDAVYDAL